MRIGILFVFVDYHRNGAHHRGGLQPQVGALIAALLPADAEIEIINDAWEDPDWSRDYDLLFISSMHSDFDRARQISHYWRRRGAKTVYGGTMAATYPHLCAPYFDAIVIGDPEDSVPRIYGDFCAGELQPLYRSASYDPDRVPIPRFDLAARTQVLPLSLEATRGCPFTCEFCALTGIGTRFHVRSEASVARDIRAGQNMLRGSVSRGRRNLVVFYDNNIGGSPRYLRGLCETLEPLGINWCSCITFNAIANTELVRMMSRSGCRILFVGLESFNADALLDMGKHQNVIGRTRQVIEQCLEHGILVTSGLMLSPQVDDIEYLESIPRRLRECGLYVPIYVCFETPIPGTPHFQRLASQPEPALLPNALLRDFNSYTLVTRPRKASVEQFVGVYKHLLDTIYSRRNRAAKLLHDAPPLMRHGAYLTVLLDAIDQYQESYRSDPARTYVAGTDREPPEMHRVPLTPADFDSQEQRDAVMEPWKVADAEGRILPAWLDSRRVYAPKGRIRVRTLDSYPLAHT
jgi:hypothetical protein